MRLWIRNATIVTMAGEKAEQPLIGDMFVEGGRIAAIGKVKDDMARLADEVIDAFGMVAMPGLVNGHNHSPMSLLRGFSDDLKLMDWLNRKMLPAEANMTPDDIYWGAMLAIAEMIKSGTTCFADMYIHMDRIAEAVRETGIRASLSRGLVFVEDDGGRRLREATELIEKWSGAAEGRITTMLAPHAPYTCPPEPLAKVAELARQLQVPLHTHLAETVEETAMIRAQYGKSPARYLHDLGLFDGSLHVLLAHGVHLDEADLDLLAGNRGGVVHNPTSNMKLGCGIAPIQAMRERGITVGLGTDGAGSATTLDLFKEMRAAAGLRKVASGDPTQLDAYAVLRMATAEGAKLLGIGHETGTLEVGKAADLILLNMNQPHLVPRHNIHALLASAVQGADVDTTIVNGRVLMQSRKLRTIDEPALLEEAVARGRRIVQGI